MAEVMETRTVSPVIEERRIDFAAIWCGALCALGLLLVFNLVGNAIGLTVMRNARVPQGALTTGQVLWALGVPLVTFLFGSLVGVSVSRIHSPALGAVHGLVIWALCILLLAAASLLAMMVGPAVMPAISSDLFWLMFFSACLALAGAVFGGYLGCRPEAHRAVQVERRVTA